MQKMDALFDLKQSSASDEDDAQPEIEQIIEEEPVSLHRSTTVPAPVT